jgi:hypothetical protein
MGKRFSKALATGRLGWIGSEIHLEEVSRAESEGRKGKILTSHSSGCIAVCAEKVRLVLLQQLALFAGVDEPLPALIHLPLRFEDVGFALFPAGLDGKAVALDLTELGFARSPPYFVAVQCPTLVAVAFERFELFKSRLPGANRVTVLPERGLFLSQPHRQQSLHRELGRSHVNSLSSQSSLAHASEQTLGKQAFGHGARGGRKILPSN